MSNSAHQHHLSLSTWACTQVDVSMHTDADAQISLTQPAAVQLLHYKQMGSTLWLPGWGTYFWHIDLLWFALFCCRFWGGHGVCGATHTGITLCSSTFCTVKPNGSSHCYTERKDVVHCWNAASSQVKISILETANIGSCVLLNPVALCKAGSVLSGSADTTQQGRLGPICNRTWVQCVHPLPIPEGDHPPGLW